MTLDDDERELLKLCITFRIKELKEAIGSALRRGNGAHLWNLRLTGLEAEAELDKLYQLRSKIP